MVRLQVDAVAASALAAVSSAVLLSSVGVAGTIIGAAVGSVVATAGSAIYSYYLRITHERVAQAQAAALDRVARARAGASGVWADTRRAEAQEQRTQLLRAQSQAEEAGEEGFDMIHVEDDDAYDRIFCGTSSQDPDTEGLLIYEGTIDPLDEVHGCQIQVNP